MRDSYHDDLDTLGGQLVELGAAVRQAIARATSALLDADLTLAETVVSGDERIDELRARVDAAVYDLLARQQPVATDLRRIIFALRTAGDLERMGDNAVHLAQIARRRYPDQAIPAELRPTVLEMGRTAETIVAKAIGVMETDDVAAALEVDRDDDTVDRLHRTLLRRLLDPGRRYGAEAAIDVAAASRALERYADHAVNVARGVVFLATGEHADDLPASGAV